MLGARSAMRRAAGVMRARSASISERSETGGKAAREPRGARGGRELVLRGPKQFSIALEEARGDQRVDQLSSGRCRQLTFEFRAKGRRPLARFPQEPCHRLAEFSGSRTGDGLEQFR